MNQIFIKSNYHTRTRPGTQKDTLHCLDVRVRKIKKEKVDVIFASKRKPDRRSAERFLVIAHGFHGHGNIPSSPTRCEVVDQYERIPSHTIFYILLK